MFPTISLTFYSNVNEKGVEQYVQMGKGNIVQPLTCNIDRRKVEQCYIIAKSDVS